MQRITPIEIRQKSFEKQFRGYDIDEVDSFLHSLAYVWEKMLGQLDDTIKSLEYTQKEVKRLHGIENAILRVTSDAETNARSIIEQAQERAALRLQEVSLEAEKRLQEAQKHVNEIEAKIKARQQEQEEQTKNKLAAIHKDIREAEIYRDTTRQQIRHLAEGILTQVATQDHETHHPTTSNTSAP